MRGAQPPEWFDEGSEWQCEREGRTGSEYRRVVDVGRVDETGSARNAADDEADERQPHEGA